MQADDQHPIVLFDGVCNLCEGFVQFVIRNDRNAQFRFAPLQSVPGQRLLREYQSVDELLSSVLLLSGDKIHRKSRAALHVAKRLDGAWPALYYLFFWIPPRLADWIYDLVGNRRYRWFGQKAECWIPNKELQSRFLDNSDSEA